MNNIDYIENPDRWGKNINISLADIVNEFMATIQPDDYVANVSRQHVLIKARTILSELYFDVVNEVRAVKLEVSSRLTIPLPEDYVGYVRLSYVDDEGKVHLMTKNDSNAIAKEYLQDMDYNYLFDDEGNILEGDGRDDMTLDYYNDNRCIHISRDQRLFYNGTFKIDNSKGAIYVSSELAGYEIILEYLTDGLEKKKPSEIYIHKFAKKAMLDGIFYELITNRRNVPEYAIVRARKYYINSKRKAKARINAINYSDLFKTVTEYT